MKTSHLGFEVNRVEIVEDDVRMQIKNSEDERLEVKLGFHVNPFSGGVTMNPILHYVDPESSPWFSDSMPWQEWFEKNGIQRNDG